MRLYLIYVIMFLQYHSIAATTPDDFWDSLPPIDTSITSATEEQLSQWLLEFLPGYDNHVRNDFFNFDPINEPIPNTPVTTPVAAPPVHQEVSQLFGSQSSTTTNPFLSRVAGTRRRNSARQSSRSRRQETRDVTVPILPRGRPLMPRSVTDPDFRVKQRQNAQSSPRGRKGDCDENKEHGCDICGKRFARHEHVNRHIRSVHTKERPFECSICGNRFSRNDNLSQHLKVHDAYSN